jgi:hypothetical protein
MSSPCESRWRRPESTGFFCRPTGGPRKPLATPFVTTIGLAGLSFLLAACMTPRTRAPEAQEVDAKDCWLPRGAQPGTFITWSLEATALEPDDTREVTLACVEDVGGLVTMERREVLVGGSTRVTAMRFRPDGTLVGAWRGSKGGLGSPLRIVRTPPTDWKAEADRMRKAVGLPPPDVASSREEEWVDTLAGRYRCVKHSTRISLLFFSGRFTTWHAVSPLPLSSLVKMEMDIPGYRMVETLKAVGAKGAQPTLTIPPDGR